MKQFDPDLGGTILRSLLGAQVRPAGVHAGVGDDDCAIQDLPGDGLLVSTIDYFNANPIIFELGIGDERDLGWLLVTANVSDLCSSAALPLSFLFGCCMERGAETGLFEEIAYGVVEACAEYSIPLVGGDTKIGRTRSVVGAALGYSADKRGLLTQRGCRAGDHLWSSGLLGDCNAVVVAASESLTDSLDTRWVQRAVARPRAPTEVARALNGARTSGGGIDLSDGLGANLSLLCKQSRVGVRLYAELLPMSAEATAVASKLSIPPAALAFGCGGDFQFIAALDPSFDSFAADIGMTMIGEFTSNLERVVETYSHGTVELPAGGHSDKTGRTFSEEVYSLVREAAGALE